MSTYKTIALVCELPFETFSELMNTVVISWYFCRVDQKDIGNSLITYYFVSDEEKWGPVSIEFFNYALALAVYAVRYPAVFWNTNKWWGIIFSFQLFINGLQNLLVYVGICVLYKVSCLKFEISYEILRDAYEDRYERPNDTS